VSLSEDPRLTVMGRLAVLYAVDERGFWPDEAATEVTRPSPSTLYVIVGKPDETGFSMKATCRRNCPNAKTQDVR